MRSAFYDATVRHTRHRPTVHSFRYRSYYLLWDLDEAPDTAARVRGLGHNRFNLMSFHDADHGDGGDLRSWAERLVAANGGPARLGRIRVLAHPRVLGFVFNPLSEWYCEDTEGRLAAVIHEVHNTFGDRHSYVHIVDGDLDHAARKRLHVSPFMPMDQTYEFTMVAPGDRVATAIGVLDGDGEIFRAAVSGTRMPLTTRSLLRLFVTRPLVTVRTVVGIHHQAVRLFLKRTPFFRRPGAPVAEHSSTTPLDKVPT